MAAGAEAPLARNLHTAYDIHGESGLGGPEEIPGPTFELDDRNAVQLIADTLRVSPEPVTLIPTGPLTNIATFLRGHPELKEKIAHVSLMGGSIGLGNTTPAAEFNVYVDPGGRPRGLRIGIAHNDERPGRDASGRGRAGGARPAAGDWRVPDA